MMAVAAGRWPSRVKVSAHRLSARDASTAQRRIPGRYLRPDLLRIRLSSRGRLAESRYSMR